MKTLFAILSDSMFFSYACTGIGLIVWIIMAALGSSNSGHALAFCIGLAIGDVILTVAAFIVWRNGGAPGGDDPPGKEGGTSEPVQGKEAAEALDAIHAGRPGGH